MIVFCTRSRHSSPPLAVSLAVLLVVPLFNPLAAGCAKFGFLMVAKLYFVPYWINVMWLDVVTYLHHTDKEVREEATISPLKY